MVKQLLDKFSNLYKRIFMIVYILLLIFMVKYIVYIAGGAETVFTHIMYVPIIISAYLFGIKGGVVTAFLAGIILGPSMPFNVTKGMMQEPISWIFRIVFFVIMGLVIGGLFHHIKKEKEIQIKKSYENLLTGYPNSNKLKDDLNRMVNMQKDFSLVVFKIINLDRINRYVDYTIGEKSVFKLLEILTIFFAKDNIYSVHTNEMVVIMKECSIEMASLKAKEILNRFKEPIFIDGLPVRLVIKGGIANFPQHSKSVNNLLKKLDRTLDQEEVDKNGICIYETAIAQKNKNNYKIVVSLYEAIKHNNFKLVYQPKIKLINNEVIGFEALLRWNDDSQRKIPVGEFIKIAEEAGIINDITKWVIKNTIVQLKKWQEEGIITKVAINISANDLKDNSIIEYTKNCIRASQIEAKMLEFELTERTIVENENKVKHFLNDIRDMGLKTSLDDFGTGHNSLMNFMKLPIDYIKIDKFFIDNIKDIQDRLLIEGIINSAHNQGKEIIAEGVENKEQMEILNNMGCDNIQGYYFSKPLPPEDIKDFILSFNKFASF